MKPSELVVGQKYEAKLMRKSTKHGWDCSFPVVYEGTEDEGSHLQSFLFREADKDAAGYVEDQWVFYRGALKKVRPFADTNAYPKEEV